MQVIDYGHVVLRAVVTGFGGFSPHEHCPEDEAVGVLARWACGSDSEAAAVVAFVQQGRTAACITLTSLLQGDTIEITGCASLVEALPYLKRTILVEVISVQILSRAPQAWQRNAPA